MMTISFILGQLSVPLNQIAPMLQTYQAADNSSRRIEDINNLQEESRNDVVYQPFSFRKGLFLKDVSFKYMENASAYVINNLTVTIPKGKITAIVGVSGSGKTTLLKLLLSFYQPQRGAIFIDDLDLADIEPDTWRQKCGVVMQNGYIYSGTIMENIAFGDEFPDIERVKKASELACINGFIDSLPMKFHTKIGKVGVNLSGGQEQRILIARAIYRNPEVILFDEATSSLDADNERAILNNLDTFFRYKTVVVIAHRLSTVKNADNIVVLDHGTIVEEGTHDKLIDQKGAYYRLVQNQLELGG